MTASIDSVTKAGGRAYTYTYSGTSPFKRYKRGQYIGNTTSTNLTITIEDDNKFNTGDTEEPIPLEVLDADDTTTAQNIEFSPRITLQWRGTTYADYYRVERKISGTWTHQAIIKDDGRGYFKYTTQALSDDTQYELRVIGTDTDGNDGTPLTYTVDNVCNPEPPSINVAYSSATGLMTVSSR